MKTPTPTKPSELSVSEVKCWMDFDPKSYLSRQSFSDGGNPQSPGWAASQAHFSLEKSPAVEACWGLCLPPPRAKS